MNIEEYIKSCIHEVDINNLVENIIKELITDDIRTSIKEVVDSKVKFLIEQQLVVIFAGEVTTNDGFGRINKYDNFEQLFKQALKKQMDESYNLNNHLEKAVRDHVERLFREKAKEVKDKFIKELTK